MLTDVILKRMDSLSDVKGDRQIEKRQQLKFIIVLTREKVVNNSEDQPDKLTDQGRADCLPEDAERVERKRSCPNFRKVGEVGDRSVVL